MSEPLLKPGDGGIEKSSANFVGAFQADEEQLKPREPGQPSAASLNLVDRWIAIMSARVEELRFAEVRAFKPPDDAEQSE